MSDTYYSILGVSKNATSKRIRERFLQLARERHPDRFTTGDKEQAESEFQLVTQAYNVLHDPARRRQYDQDLELRRVGPGTEEDVKTHAARVYVKRGVEAYKSNKMLQAVQNFERATQEDPQDAQAWHYLAKALSHRSSWMSRALAAAAKASELDSMNATYLKQAGQLAAQAGMATRALKYLTKALTFGGDDPEVKLLLEQVREEAKKEL
jgi:curved DNA-binding protein CbpA